MGMLRYRRGRFLLLLHCLGRKSNTWRSFVHQFFRYGVKDSPARFENAMSAPLKPPSEKRYILAIHPHGLLCDGWHIVVAKQQPDTFKPETSDFCGVTHFKPFLCF